MRGSWTPRPQDAGHATALSTLLITGGAGRIATALRPLLRPRFSLRLADLRPPAEDAAPDDFVQADVQDLAAIQRACAGVDAVLHLAGQPSTSATWHEVRGANIEGTYNVFEAARRNGVRKVVFASTNHVMGFLNLEGAWPISVDSAIRPDSLYGVSKAFGEALARYYSDAFDMSMICLRIGWFTPRDPTASRHQPLWISARDLAQVVTLCLDSPRPFGIYNATSNNAQGHWDLERTRSDLGYAPQDDVTKLDLVASDDGVVYCDPCAGVLRGLS
jgi:nucleoside-diphosphate-sugar epimerase